MERLTRLELANILVGSQTLYQLNYSRIGKGCDINFIYLERTKRNENTYQKNRGKTFYHTLEVIRLSELSPIYSWLSKYITGGTL